MSALGKPVTTYTYVDENGTPVHEVLRFENPKTFRQRAVDGHGGHTWGLDGVRRVPYNLPAIVDARTKGRAIVIVEGEKDADALTAQGFAATTNCGGAGWKWTPEFLEHFRGVVCAIVIPDADAPGREAAAKRAELLADFCEDVRVLELAPDRADGYDVSDWFAEGHDAKDLRERVKAAPRFERPQPQLPPEAKATPPGLRIESAAIIARQAPEMIEWDVESLLPADDAPALFFGPPASLKSWVGLSLCEAIVTGKPFLGRYPVRQRDRVLYLNLDAGAKTFRNRVRRVSDAAGFEFVSMSAGEFNFEILRTLMAERRGAFIVIDCLSAIYSPDRTQDPAFAMRAFVDALRAIFAEYECGGVIIDHPHRPKERGELGDYHGSVQKEAAFRTMWQIAAEPADDADAARRTKISCRKLSEGQPFSPVHVRVDFTGERITFTTAIHDDVSEQSDLELKIIDWARTQVRPFSKTGCEKAIDGRAVDIRNTFIRLAGNGTFIPTGTKRNGGDLFELATTSTTSGTQLDMVDGVADDADSQLRPPSGTGSDVVDLLRPGTQTTTSPPIGGRSSGTGSGTGFGTGSNDQTDSFDDSGDRERAAISRSSVSISAIPARRGDEVSG